jgi:hypothetical protein
MSFLRNAVLALSLAAASCGTSYVSTKTADPVLLEGQDVAEVRAAIIRAMKLRKFKPKSEGPGMIVAKLERGDESVEVAIEYSGSQFLIRYLASEGLETAKVEDELMIESAYASYTKKLASVIEKELARPAAERAEAEANRREYELMLARAKAGADQPAQTTQGGGGDPVGPTVGGILEQVGSKVGPVQLDGSVRHSEQSLTCCINGAKYNCPGQDAFNACMTKGPSQCTPAGGC